MFDVKAIQFWRLSNAMAGCSAIAFIPKRRNRLVFGTKHGTVAVVDIGESSTCQNVMGDTQEPASFIILNGKYSLFLLLIEFQTLAMFCIAPSSSMTRSSTLSFHRSRPRRSDSSVAPPRSASYANGMRMEFKRYRSSLLSRPFNRWR